MTDIGKALEYCHKQRVLHLNVKLQNILVNVSTKVCKLYNFGNSCLLMEEGRITDSDTVNTSVIILFYLFCASNKNFLYSIN